MRSYIADYPAHYKRKKDAGLCLHCGKIPPLPGKSYCKEHYEWHQAYSQKYSERKKQEKAAKRAAKLARNGI